jgi:SpoVK/Ycf46/Vps4 family AAA+-type ATPase
MKLPNVDARTQILTRHIGELPPELQKVEVADLIPATEGFTGADLKRLVDDGKTLYAYDKAKGFEMKGPTEYFLKAVEGVRENKQRYAEAETQAMLKPKASMAGISSFVMRQFSSQGGADE